MTTTHDLLRDLVEETECFPGWSFSLRYADSSGTALELRIQIDSTNNYDHSKPFVVNHCHPVPHASYNEATWKRWIFDQCVRTLNHELGENLKIKGVRSFPPMHGPGEDPYTVHEIRPEKDALTTQNGSLREGPV